VDKEQSQKIEDFDMEKRKMTGQLGGLQGSFGLDGTARTEVGASRTTEYTKILMFQDGKMS
jgi:hypothetical protein